MRLRSSLLLIAAGFALDANAQDANAQDADTLTSTLDPIVVTAERTNSILSASTGGVSVLKPAALRVLPNRNAGSLLGLLPGLTFLDFDGMGYAPQAVTRGFYGGGEAEYVILLLNGKPVNNLENGLVNWEQLATSPSTRIEVLRGGASSLYGDAAIGAVINVRSDAPLVPYRSVEVGGGSLGSLFASSALSGRRYSLQARYDATDGFRDHSARSSATFNGSRRLIDAPGRSLSAAISLNNRESDTPGPLRTTDTTEDGHESLAFFQFDNAHESSVRGSLDGDVRLANGRPSGSLGGILRNHDLVRTLPLSADFADTQEREVDALSFTASVQLSETVLPMGFDNELVIGVDASLGTLDSRYHAIATGGLDDAYATATGDRGDVLSEGSSSRLGLAGYAQLDLSPSPRLRVTLGGRFVRIRDSFDEVAGLSDAAETATHTALSPKVGVNFRYRSTPDEVGRVYVSASRSFKAPTLDQLYDLRAFPVPFPPFAIRIANDGLVPQEGTSYEAGFYHLFQNPDGWSARVAGSAYTLDMTNEIDFSFETFSNVNIGESRHRGVELDLSAEKLGNGSLFVAYTLQDVTLQAGDNEGKAVKAIPRHALSVGGMTEASSEIGTVSAGVVVRSLRDIWVDDANTVPLADYATVDVRLALDRGPSTLSLDLYNALDKRYDSTAYQDPAGSDVLFVFPAAGRTVALRLKRTF